MSRPSSSVPSRCFSDGDWSEFASEIFVALYGAINGERTAIVRNKLMMINPAIPVQLRRNRRNSRSRDLTVANIESEPRLGLSTVSPRELA